MRYFSCTAKHGVFVREDTVTVVEKAVDASVSESVDSTADTRAPTVAPTARASGSGASGDEAQLDDSVEFETVSSLTGVNIVPFSYLRPSSGAPRQ